VPLYFAYGSNMSRAGMRRRCPAAQAVGTARLIGWQFIVMRQGYASIVRSSGAVVHGVLWRLSARDLAVLDCYEGLASGLYRRCTLCVRHGPRMVPALIYIGRSALAGRPTATFQRDVVLPARDEWQLPRDYVARLQRRVPAAWRARAQPAAGECHE
jgi:gamma-glutamylcyclotransferase (GGCT)/AIG2-like uncharacterized protein YtfP